jgi:glyoxylase I family protein
MNLARALTNNSKRQLRSEIGLKAAQVIGPTDHTIFQSIYFRDPSGHRIELAVWTATPEQLARMKAVAPEMVEEWSRTKKPPRHTAWLHEKEFIVSE